MQAKLSFQNLNTFAAAAKALSFQDAAEVLHVTPSAVSHQIRSLESMLGYPLFDRLDKRIRLTKRGAQFYSEIREPLQQLHQASQKALCGSDDNALALSVAPVFATRWLLPRLKDFRASCPEVNLSVIATTSLVDFRSDPFDAAVRIGDGHWPDTVARPLFRQRIVAVCHPRLLAKHQGGFAIDELTQQPLIHNSWMSTLWEDWFASAGIVLPGALGGIEVQGSAQVLEAVHAEDAVGLIDLSFIDDDLEQGRLVLACDHVLVGDDGYFLVYPQAARERISLQLFERWIASQVDVVE